VNRRVMFMAVKLVYESFMNVHAVRVLRLCTPPSAANLSTPSLTQQAPLSGPRPFLAKAIHDPWPGQLSPAATQDYDLLLDTYHLIVIVAEAAIRCFAIADKQYVLSNKHASLHITPAPRRPRSSDDSATSVRAASAAFCGRRASGPSLGSLQA